MDTDAGMPLENEKHELFCLEYVARNNATRAYMQVYPKASYRSARSAAPRLLANVDISERVTFLREEQKTRLKMTGDDVLMGLAMAARFDPADLFNQDGCLIPIHELPPETRLCIEKIEYNEVTIGEGEEKKTIGRIAKIQVISKRSAYELLGRHHKLFTDRHEHVIKRTLEDILGEAEDEEIAIEGGLS